MQTLVEYTLLLSQELILLSLEKYLKGLMAGRPYRITKKWSGPILEPSDGLPLIGHIKPHQYVATGFSGNGMTYAGVAATLLRDLLLGLENPWKTLYDPRRIPSLQQLLKKGKDYIGEFFGGAVRNTIYQRG